MEIQGRPTKGKIPVLMGMKHCGKTTLGSLLAARLGIPFLDLDDLVEAAAATIEGRRMQVRDIYRRLGREGFRNLELRALEETAHGIEAEKTSFVLALGGGTIENPEGLAVLADYGVFIYLEEEEGTLFRRILAGGLPPFLQGDDPEKAFRLLYEKRTALYRAHADLVVPVHGLTPEEGVGKILAKLREN